MKGIVHLTTTFIKALIKNWSLFLKEIKLNFGVGAKRQMKGNEGGPKQFKKMFINKCTMFKSFNNS